MRPVLQGVGLGHVYGRGEHGVRTLEGVSVSPYPRQTP